MLNKMQIMFKGIEDSEKVIVRYRGMETPMELKELFNRTDGKGVGHILGTGGMYVVDCIKHTDPITVEITAVKTLIESAAVVDKITSYIQKKGKGMSHIQIILDSYQVDKVTYADNHIGFVKIAENRAVREHLFQIEDSVVLRHGKDSMRINKDDKYAATLEILSLCYGGDDEQGQYAIKNDLFMQMKDDGSYRFYLKQGSKLYDLESNAVLESTEGLRRYRAFGASPSNDRQKVIYFIDVTNGVDHANDILDILTWGAYRLEYGKQVSYDKLAKLSTRWFQWMAPCISLGTIGRLAVYLKKFNKDKADGMALASSEGMSQHINETTGYNIAPAALNGVFWQGRPAQTKAGFMNIPETVLWDVVYGLDSDPIIRGWDEITPEFIADVCAGKYDGRVMILGEGTLEFLFDKNALKSDYNYALKPEYTVLRFLHANSSNFSSTIFQKMVAKDSVKAAEYASNLAREEIFDRMKNAYIDPKARIIEPEKFNENFFMDEIISSLFPSYLKMDKNISMNVLDNVTKAVNKMLQKFKVPMQGKNSGLTVGLEVFFGLNSLLGDHEVLCPAAEKEFKKLGIPESEWKIFMIKYPSMDVDEYQIAHVISRATMKARIKNSGLSKKLQAILINYYCSLHDSVIVVPACELFKKMLAGSDFDTDQVCWSMDKNLLDILEHDPVAIVIED